MYMYIHTYIRRERERQRNPRSYYCLLLVQAIKLLPVWSVGIHECRRLRRSPHVHARSPRPLNPSLGDRARASLGRRRCGQLGRTSHLRNRAKTQQHAHAFFYWRLTQSVLVLLYVSLGLVFVFSIWVQRQETVSETSRWTYRQLGKRTHTETRTSINRSTKTNICTHRHKSC